MQVYIMRAMPDDYDSIDIINDEDFTLDDALDGTSRIATWQTLNMRYFSEVEPPDYPKCDYPSFINIPCFSPKAAEALQDLLEGNGELLPLDVSGDPYYMFNITNVIDCLDYDKSDIDSYTKEGSIKILGVVESVLLDEKINSSCIFKLPEFLYSYHYVTQPFVDRVEECGLTGFNFQLIYDSDAED